MTQNLDDAIFGPAVTADPAAAEAEGEQPTPRRSRRRRVWLIIGIVLLVLVVLIVWLGVRVVNVASDLQAAQSLAKQMQTEAVDFRFADIDATSTELEEKAASAAGQTGDPVWRMAELVPGLGANLYAVRAAAESIDELVNEVAAPAIDIAVAVDPATASAAGGSQDLSALGGAGDVIITGHEVLDRSRERLDKVDTDATFAPVTKAVEQLQGLLTTAEGALDEGGEIMHAAGAVFGQDGERNIVLAFQNNAESTALGGSAAAFTLLHINDGVVTVGEQFDSRDFPLGQAVDVPVDPSAMNLYGSYLVDHLNTATSRPDFPTAAKIITAYWARDRGVAIDGVVSIDPLALSYILRATGPVTLATGDVLTSENAVSLLVNEAYFRYPEYEQTSLVDDFFGQASAAILDKVITGDFDIKTMFDSLSESIQQGSILVWSNDPGDQAKLDGTRVQGVLPTTNDDATVMGVYYRDTSSSKMDYYLQTSTQTTSNACVNADDPTFSTTVRLHSNITVAEARALPYYIASRFFGSDSFSTEVFIYGPAGASLTDARVDDPGLRTDITASDVDLGRPVASFRVNLQPGQSAQVTATFAGTPGTYGPLEVVGTPMINATTHTSDQEAVCGAVTPAP